MDFGTVSRTREHDCLALVVDQIPDCRQQPVFQALRRSVSECFRGRITEFGSNDRRSDRDEACRKRLAVVRHTAGERVAVFQDVKTVHVRRLGILGPVLGESGDRLAGDRIESEEVAIERENAHGSAELHKRLHTRAENRLADCCGTIGASGFVTEKLNLREGSLHFTQQTQERRRGAGTGHDAQTRAFFGIRSHGGEQFIGLFPGEFLALAERLLRTRRIIKIEHGSLSEAVDTAAQRVKRIAGDVRRTAFMRGDDKRRGAAAARHRRGVHQSLARHHPFDVLGVGENAGQRAAAACQSHKADAGAHDLQKVTATVFTFFVRQGVTSGELAPQVLEEILTTLQFGDTAPVALRVLRLLGMLPNSFHVSGKGERGVSGGRRCSFPAAESASAS